MVTTEELGGAAAAQIEEIEITLHHHHLPMLEAVGLIGITDDDEVEVVPSPSIWADESFETFVQTNLIPTDEMNKALLALSNDGRRQILNLLNRHRDITTPELADHFAEDVRGGLGSNEGNSGPMTELVHAHIPKLEELGIIESDGQQIHYAGHPLLDDWWFSPSRESSSEGEAYCNS